MVMSETLTFLSGSIVQSMARLNAGPGVVGSHPSSATTFEIGQLKIITVILAPRPPPPAPTTTSPKPFPSTDLRRVVVSYVKSMCTSTD